MIFCFDSFSSKQRTVDYIGDLKSLEAGFGELWDWEPISVNTYRNFSIFASSGVWLGDKRWLFQKTTPRVKPCVWNHSNIGFGVEERNWKRKPKTLQDLFFVTKKASEFAEKNLLATLPLLCEQCSTRQCSNKHDNTDLHSFFTVLRFLSRLSDSDRTRYRK